MATSPSLVHGSLQKTRQKKYKSQRWWTSRKQWFPYVAELSSQGLWQQAPDLHKPELDKIPALQGKVDTKSHPYLRRYWQLMSSFSLSSRNFKISFLISFIMQLSFISMLFSFHKFVCFLWPLLLLMSMFIPLWPDRMHNMISVVQSLLRFSLYLMCGRYFEENSISSWEERVFFRFGLNCLDVC